MPLLVSQADIVGWQSSEKKTTDNENWSLSEKFHKKISQNIFLNILYFRIF